MANIVLKRGNKATMFIGLEIGVQGAEEPVTDLANAKKITFLLIDESFTKIPVVDWSERHVRIISDLVGNPSTQVSINNPEMGTVKVIITSPQMKLNPGVYKFAVQVHYDTDTEYEWAFDDSITIQDDLIK